MKSISLSTLSLLSLTILTLVDAESDHVKEEALKLSCLIYEDFSLFDFRSL